MHNKYAALPRFEVDDQIWSQMRAEAVDMATQDPLLGGRIFNAIFSHKTFESALHHWLSRQLACRDVSSDLLEQAIGGAMASNRQIAEFAKADIVATFERDPACVRYLEPFLYNKGYFGIQTHRVAHQLFKTGRKDFALHLQARCSALFSIDIHPAASIGRGIMIDHAHAIVIGETAIVGDNVSMLHSVTLGGTGKEEGNRHPKIGDGVLIGAGASVLGNIRVGKNARVAAGSVVLKDVPENRTVAGVPARLVGKAGPKEPARRMDQNFSGEN